MGTRPEDVEPALPPEQLEEQAPAAEAVPAPETVAEPAAAAPAAPAAPPPPPAPDEEALVERLTQRVTGKLSPQLEEHYRKLAEASRSRYGNLRTQYQALRKQVDDLKASGELSPEAAQARKQELRDQYDEAVAAADQSAETAQLQQEQQRLAKVQQDQVTFQSYCNKVVSDLEFAQNDPELKELMGKVFGSSTDLDEAKDAFRREATKAIRKKDRRVAGELSAQALQTQAQRQAAQGKAIPTFTGGAAGTKPPTLETMDARLNQLLDNPVLMNRDPKGYAAWQKEVDALTAAVNKAQA